MNVTNFVRAECQYEMFNAPLFIKYFKNKYDKAVISEPPDVIVGGKKIRVLEDSFMTEVDFMLALFTQRGSNTNTMKTRSSREINVFLSGKFKALDIQSRLSRTSTSTTITLSRIASAFPDKTISAFYGGYARILNPVEGVSPNYQTQYLATMGVTYHMILFAAGASYAIDVVVTKAKDREATNQEQYDKMVKFCTTMYKNGDIKTCTRLSNLMNYKVIQVPEALASANNSIVFKFQEKCFKKISAIKFLHADRLELTVYCELCYHNVLY